MQVIVVQIELASWLTTMKISPNLSRKRFIRVIKQLESVRDVDWIPLRVTLRSIENNWNFLT